MSFEPTAAPHTAQDRRHTLGAKRPRPHRGGARRAPSSAPGGSPVGVVSGSGPEVPSDLFVHGSDVS